jgi:hypothetical protein
VKQFVLVCFLSLWQIPEINQLKQERVHFYFSFSLVVQGLKFRVSCLLNRHSTNWAWATLSAQEKVNFESQFQRFQFMVTWSHCFGPLGTLYIVVGLCGKGGLFTSWWLGIKERDSRRRNDRVLISFPRSWPQ